MVHGFKYFGRHTGQCQRAPDLFPQRGEHFHLPAGMLVRLTVLDVDDPDDAVPGNDRSGKERLEIIFRKFPEVFETRVFICVSGDCQEASLAGYPTGEALVQFEPNTSDLGFVVRIGSAQHQIQVVAKVDEA